MGERSQSTLIQGPLCTLIIRAKSCVSEKLVFSEKLGCSEKLIGFFVSSVWSVGSSERIRKTRFLRNSDILAEKPSLSGRETQFF